MSGDDEGVTIGEVGRRLSSLEGDMRQVQNTLGEIKMSLAGQSVKVGVVWAGLGLGATALITSSVGTAIAVLAR